MRRNLSCLGIVFIFSFLLSTVGDQIEVRTITIATGVNSDPPFVYGDYTINWDHPGITIEILQQIEQRLGIRFTIAKHPWVRVVDEVRGNLIDGGVHFSFQPARTSFVAYPIREGEVAPDPQYSISSRSYRLYQMNTGSLSWDGSSLGGVPGSSARVGYIKGGSVYKVLRDQDITLVALSTDWQLVQMLISGRIDAIVALENMVESHIQRLSTPQQLRIRKEKLPVLHQAYYIGFSRQFFVENQELVWSIWNEIALMKESGFVSALFEKYRDIRE